MRGWFAITTGRRIAALSAMTRVLLVEDSADVLDFLQMELNIMGYDVDAQLDASLALMSAQLKPPDVIVSDIGMPGMDGLEFIKRIRKTPRLAAVPAIALTGASMARDVEQALAFVFTTHLVKPVEATELCHRIELLTARRLQRKAG